MTIKNTRTPKFGGPTNSRIGQSLTTNPTGSTWGTGLTLICQTTTVSNTYNDVSGMLNPVVVDGTSTFSFLNIPQDFRDLVITFGNMGHNTVNNGGYRPTMWLNNDTTNNRYYSRQGVQAYQGASWNADNVDRFYLGYCYRLENNGWASAGELVIPTYSKNLPSNYRNIYGQWWNMNFESYPQPWGGQYYNNTVASYPITRIDFGWESNVGYRNYNQIALYGRG